MANPVRSTCRLKQTKHNSRMFFNSEKEAEKKFLFDAK
jgi:hypothetical protein